MQTRNRLFDDLAKMANSAAGTMAGLKDEIENTVRHKVESFLGEMNLVTREEFEAVKAMAAKARTEQERLEKRLAVLEGAGSKPKKAAKAGTKNPSGKKSARKRKSPSINKS